MAKFVNIGYIGKSPDKKDPTKTKRYLKIEHDNPRALADWIASLPAGKGKGKGGFLSLMDLRQGTLDEEKFAALKEWKVADVVLVQDE